MSARPLAVLIVLDGFGCRKETEFNAIAQSKHPTFHRLFSEFPWTTIEASGLSVGLPKGQMGNSEVGHLNIGAGRIVDQDIVRISKSVDSGEIARNPELVAAFDRVKRDRKAVHLVGLLSDGGVHSLQQHLDGYIRAAMENGVAPVYIHAILDGRDTPPVSAVANLHRLLDFISNKRPVQLSTIIGRYYTMDRDKRWERVKRGYDLMTIGAGTETTDPIATVQKFYSEGKTDEFMEPIAVVGKDGKHRGNIEDGDLVLFFNFRSDRMRQIVTTFRDADFNGFERTKYPHVQLMSSVRYREDFDFPIAFPRVEVHNHLGEVYAANGMKQLRIAETEKYAHVTFFFNGGSDKISEGEDRVLIQSQKVATYDLKPEMSVPELSARVIQEIDSKKYDAIVLNIANPDMVGHTGVMDATITAVEATDAALAKILEAVDRSGGFALITADHGNCELMFDRRTGQPHTAHTTSPVPLILYSPHEKFGTLRDGGALENVAPTILDILGIAKPAEMTAASLLVRDGR